VRVVKDLLEKGASTCIYKPFLNIERLLRVIEELRGKKGLTPPQ